MRPLSLLCLNDGKSYACEKDFLLIGRQEVCDLRIDHKSVSKQHCVLVKRGEQLWLRDLGSTNGSHVNGKRVRRSPVKPKDVLGVAGFSFRLVYADKPIKEADDQGGTKKLTPEEIERLQQKEGDLHSSSVSAIGPVIQVNALPDEYTPEAAE